MLQYITHPSPNHSIVEQVCMALDGGCRWIQLRLKEASDDEFRAIAREIIPKCRDAEAFLVFDDRVELTKEMEVHGVHLGNNDMHPAKARELLGPGAIIGVTAHSADDILRYRGLDIDYFGVGPFKPTTTKKLHAEPLGFVGYHNIVKTIRQAGIDIPIVAIGGITMEDISAIMNTGVNGIALSGTINNAPNPTETTAKILELLYKGL